MKKILTLVLTSILLAGVLFSGKTSAQTFKLSGYYGSTNTSLVVTLKPDFNFNDKLNEVGFVIQVPKMIGATPVTPMPTITVLTNFLSTTFADWVQVSESASDPDFYNYKFGATGFASAPVLTKNSGEELQVVELQISGAQAAAAMSTVRIAHLSNGGPFFQYGVAIFDGSINDRTSYRQMFYGTDVIPAVPAPDEVSGYGTYQHARLSNAAPVKFTTFTAVRKNDDGILNWKIENEGDLTDRYEVERSFNGTDFTKINTVAPKDNGSSSNSYDYIDKKLSTLGSNGVIYYRIRQVDKDSKFANTEIRSIRLDGKTFDVSIYPNPVVTGSGNVYIDLAKADKITIKLIDAAGKQIQSAVINGTDGLNTYTLNMRSLATGTYYVKVVSGEQTKTIPVIKK
ncbi:MAG: T9SS type A sorting domain-containing protein [Ferruginibacter sp.]